MGLKRILENGEITIGGEIKISHNYNNASASMYVKIPFSNVENKEDMEMLEKWVNSQLEKSLKQKIERLSKVYNGMKGGTK